MYKQFHNLFDVLLQNCHIQSFCWDKKIAANLNVSRAEYMCRGWWVHAYTLRSFCGSRSTSWKMKQSTLASLLVSTNPIFKSLALLNGFSSACSTTTILCWNETVRKKIQAEIIIVIINSTYTFKTWNIKYTFATLITTIIDANGQIQYRNFF